MPPSSKLLLPLCLLATFLVFAAVLPTHAETFRNPHRIPLPVDPYAVTTGDLDGDGRNDIVWTERPVYPGPVLFHVLLAHANGQYTSAPDLSLPFYPAFVDCIVEDVTGDKHNDLVCLGASNNYTDVFLVTYLGKGDGTFSSPVQTRVTSQPENPILARAGDLNGDGLPDILVMDAYNSGTLPYLSDGRGGFTAAPSFAGSFNYSVPTMTDLNGDGKLDVLWPTGPRVNLGNGDGSFSPPVAYDPGFDSNCAFGDVDHDGHLDAVCTSFDNQDLNGAIHLTVLHGNTDGSFDTHPLFTRTFGNGENASDGLATILSPVLVADLNGDGFADIVSLSGDGYSVLLGGANTTWNGPPQQFVAASFQSQGGLLGIYGVSIADMNGDGLPDIVAIGPNGLYLTYAQRDGTLNSAPAAELGQISTSAALVDVNGDGNLDVVSTGDTALKLSLGRGDGTFNAPQPITSTGNFTRGVNGDGGIVSGDFNGDGRQDLIAAGSIGPYTAQNYILFGRGDGTFSTPAPTPVMLGKVVDLNSDGRSDVISIQNNATTGNLLVASLSRGDGTFTPVSTSLPAEIANGFTIPSSGPALADFRHSGHLDAAIASSRNAYVLPGRGDGTFDANVNPITLPDLPGLKKVAANDVATADFDHDGNPDLAVLVQYDSNSDPYLMATSSSVWVFYGKGDGTFSPPVLAGTFNRASQTLTAGDLDGDGLADLVLTSYTVYQYNGVLIVHALPNRTWGSETDYTAGEGLSPLFIADIDHDGRNDLLVSNSHRANYSSNSIAILLNEPPSTVTDTVAGILTATPEPSNVTYPFTLRAVLLPLNAADTLTGDIAFSLDGVAVGTAPLTGNSASLLLPAGGIAAGTHTLSASWPGNSTYPAVTLTGTHRVSLLPLNLVLSATPTSLFVGDTVTTITTITLSLPPSHAGYQFTGTTTLSDNGIPLAHPQVSPSGFSFKLSSLTAGTHTLSVSYAGDSLFSAAQSNAVTVTVNPLVVPGSFNLVLSPASITLPAGGAGTVAIQLTSLGNYAGTLAITLGTLPTYASTSLSLSSVPLTAGVAATSTLTLNTLLRSSRTTPATPGARALPLTFVSLLLLSLPRYSSRRSQLPRLLAIALLGFILQATTGCTNTYYNANSVAPGTYQLPVTATDPKGISKTVNLTVVLTR